MLRSLVGSEMCIRDSQKAGQALMGTSRRLCAELEVAATCVVMTHLMAPLVEEVAKSAQFRDQCTMEWVWWWCKHQQHTAGLETASDRPAPESPKSIGTTEHRSSPSWVGSVSKEGNIEGDVEGNIEGDMLDGVEVGTRDAVKMMRGSWLNREGDHLCDLLIREIATSIEQYHDAADTSTLLEEAAAAEEEWEVEEAAAAKAEESGSDSESEESEASLERDETAEEFLLLLEQECREADESRFGALVAEGSSLQRFERADQIQQFACSLSPNPEPPLLFLEQTVAVLREVFELLRLRIEVEAWERLQEMINARTYRVLKGFPPALKVVEQFTLTPEFQSLSRQQRQATWWLQDTILNELEQFAHRPPRANHETFGDFEERLVKRHLHQEGLDQDPAPGSSGMAAPSAPGTALISSGGWLDAKLRLRALVPPLTDLVCEIQQWHGEKASVAAEEQKHEAVAEEHEPDLALESPDAVSQYHDPSESEWRQPTWQLLKTVEKLFVYDNGEPGTYSLTCLLYTSPSPRDS
eukprot:TRINITY_DN12533_c0_g5_i1.p1 TRINITY_DN12533_c0_g5~~TRINITY_DN12533_c0_g5_i1.p1  ORF type:complete len:568 (-),score=126.09 TRINITY_DN12533_c0_g5_i1:133-1710(-)